MNSIDSDRAVAAATHPDHFASFHSMRRSALVMVVFVNVLTGRVSCQEPALPAQSASPSERVEQNTLLASPSPSPPSLLTPISPSEAAAIAPNLPTPPVASDLNQLDAAFKRTPLGQLSEEYRLHVEWKQLQNRAVNDPRVMEAKTAADHSKTDLEKRARLRVYYNIYYGRMRALSSSPEMKAYLDRQKDAHLALLAQPRVRPAPERAR